MRRAYYSIFLSLIVALQPGTRAQAQARVEWPTYGSDVAATKYSVLGDINRGNVQRLTIAWRWRVAE